MSGGGNETKQNKENTEKKQTPKHKQKSNNKNNNNPIIHIIFLFFLWTNLTVPDGDFEVSKSGVGLSAKRRSNSSAIFLITDNTVGVLCH